MGSAWKDNGVPSNCCCGCFTLTENFDDLILFEGDFPDGLKWLGGEINFPNIPPGIWTAADFLEYPPLVGGYDGYWIVASPANVGYTYVPGAAETFLIGANGVVIMELEFRDSDSMEGNNYSCLEFRDSSIRFNSNNRLYPGVMLSSEFRPYIASPGIPIMDPGVMSDAEWNRKCRVKLTCRDWEANGVLYDNTDPNISWFAVDVFTQRIDDDPDDDDAWSHRAATTLARRVFQGDTFGTAGRRIYNSMIANNTSPGAAPILWVPYHGYTPIVTNDPLAFATFQPESDAPIRLNNEVTWQPDADSYELPGCPEINNVIWPGFDFRKYTARIQITGAADSIMNNDDLCAQLPPPNSTLYRKTFSRTTTLIISRNSYWVEYYGILLRPHQYQAFAIHVLCRYRLAGVFPPPAWNQSDFLIVTDTVNVDNDRHNFPRTFIEDDCWRVAAWPNSPESTSGAIYSALMGGSWTIQVSSE